MTLAPGTKIGAFEVTASLGAGGMGEVYRATDTRLRREVAIKVLPEDVTRDRERLARFEREAQVLASLSHPNIGAIFGVEESGGTRCLVLELIEGETLSEVIARGPLPVDTALGIALQIAEGLEAAHDKGIVHRDLKPANVKVTPDGTVKVLDFGLAKAQADAGSQRSDLISLSPTMTAAATQAGVILGTAGYMSPEQAAGQHTDRRADVWSFGVVMLEMLTGRKTFSGETISHTLASVLKEEPDWSRLPSDLPPRVKDLLERCLTKKVRRRLQSIGEARVTLEQYKENPDSFRMPAASQTAAPAAASAAPLWMRAIPWALSAALGIALVALWLGQRDGAPPPLRRMDLVLPDGEFLFRGYGTSLTLSPDGSRIAYTTASDGSRRLYVQYLDQWEGAVLVEGPDSTTGPYQPFFSPDGQWIGYVTRTELKKVPARGGSPITLCPVERSRGASWGPDGGIVFAKSPASGLFRVPAAGGEPEELTALDETTDERSHRWPQVLPEGDAVLFTSITGRDDFDTATIEVLDLATRKRKVVHKGGSYGHYVPSGHILYYSGGTLFALPFDVTKLEPTGSSAPAVEDVAGARLEGGAHFSVSSDGTLAYATGDRSVAATTLVWADRKGAESPLWDLPQNYGALALSPDGSALAAEIESEGNTDIWVYDLKRDVPTRLTFGEGDDSAPVWSPDGRSIYFSSERDGQSSAYRKAADGSGEEELMHKGLAATPTSISPDGRNMVFMEMIKGVGELFILPLDGGDPRPFAPSPAFEYGGRYSPDGRWILYGTNESGPWEVYVRPASDERGKWQISRGGGVYPIWSPDGKAIYYRASGGSVVVVPVEADATSLKAGRVETLFDGSYANQADGATRYDIAPDGRFVLVKQGGQSSETHEHIRIVLSWLDELQKSFNASDGTSR